MHRFIPLFIILIFGWVLPIVSSNFQAVADSRVELFGVRLYCGECELRNEIGCTVYFPLEQREAGCVQASEALLKTALEGDEKHRPSPEDLRRYLLGKESSHTGALTAVNILAITPAGQNILADDADALAEKMPEVLVQFIRESEVPGKVLDAVYKIPRRKSSELLRGLVVANDTKKDPGKLVDDLPGLDTNADAEDLGQYAKALKERKPERAAEMIALQGIARNCESAKSVEFTERCLVKHAGGKMTASAEKYLGRLKTRLVIRKLTEPQTLLETKIAWLSQLDFSARQTQDSLSAVRAALDELLRAPLAKQQSILRATNPRFLTLSSRQDKETASLYGLLLIRFSAASWDQGNRDEATHALLQSYSIFPQALQARSALVERIFFGLPRETPWFQAEWEHLPKSAQDELSNTPRTGSNVISAFVGAAVTLLFLLITIFFFLVRRPSRRRARGNQDQRSNQTKHANQANRAQHEPIAPPVVSVQGFTELRDLLEYFGLSMPATDEALTREYRRKAKLLHPDTTTGTPQDFTRLTDNYQRARALLTELSRISALQDESKPRKRSII